MKYVCQLFVVFLVILICCGLVYVQGVVGFLELVNCMVFWLWILLEGQGLFIVYYWIKLGRQDEWLKFYRDYYLKFLQVLFLNINSIMIYKLQVYMIGGWDFVVVSVFFKDVVCGGFLCECSIVIINCLFGNFQIFIDEENWCQEMIEVYWDDKFVEIVLDDNLFIVYILQVCVV